MQQLTLQFEGYADNWQPIDVSSATKERSEETTALHAVRALRTACPSLADCQSALSGLIRRSHQWLGQANATATGLAGCVVSNMMVVKGVAATSFAMTVLLMAAVLQGA